LNSTYTLLFQFTASEIQDYTLGTWHSSPPFNNASTKCRTNATSFKSWCPFDRSLVYNGRMGENEK